MSEYKYDIDWANKTAKELGTELNTVKSENIGLLLGGLNKKEGGCPCVPTFAQTEDTKCPCKDMRDTGICHCGLFKNKLI
jgi:ferredoxin-thioredoxin reductase catalytic subunit